MKKLTKKQKQDRDDRLRDQIDEEADNVLYKLRGIIDITQSKYSHSK